MGVHNDLKQRNMLVMKASAGSGKTYNLALQYIRHLLFVPDENGRLVPRRHGAGDHILNAHRLLLAITFTNKATDEMKDRIVKELFRLASPGVKSDYLQEFVTQSGLDEAQVRGLARQALNELLFDYSNFNVSTIDSFFQSVLRNFTRELDRDFNYDIQLEEDYAVRVAVHNFLLSLGREDKPTQVDRWVKDYQQHMLHGDPDKRRWKFFDDGGELTAFAKQINTELFRSRMDQIRKYLGQVDDKGAFHSDFTTIREFMKFVNAAANSCQEQATAQLDELRHALQPMYDNLSGNKTFKKWLDKGEEGQELSDTLAGSDSDKIISQFLKGGVPDEATIGQLLSLVTGYFKCRLWANFLRHINNNLGLLGLLAMIDIFLEDYRHETNSILIGDTNELIGTVLDSGSEFVYERIGTTISHFLIDEFQDTSTKQYENFRGLLRESLANGNFNMLIGDAKQSIYRFRNADPTVFREKVDQDFNEEIFCPPVKPGEPTSVNYRSSRNIIQFNNRLFEGVINEYRDNATVRDTYADVEQGMPGDIDTGKVPGYVRLLLGEYGRLLDDELIRQTVELMRGQPSQGKEGEGDRADAEAEELNVLDILPGYLLKLHERYDWGQIGILVNTNAIGNQVVECILEYNKRAPAGRRINIISGESLLLNNSPIIRRIVAMLRFIDVTRFTADEDDEQDDVALSDVVRRINRKRESDQRLYAALNVFIKAHSARPDATPQQVGVLLDESLSGIAPATGDSADGSRTYKELLDVMLPPGDELSTLVSVVETIIAAFKNEGDADVDAETAFLLAFQDTVMKFSAQRNGGTVREFLKYWDEKKGSLAVSSADGGDAVNIMTIHKAKGLEFDCVVIPFAQWNLTNNPKEFTYWMPRETFVDVLRSMPVSSDCDKTLVPPLLNVSKSTLSQLKDGGFIDGLAKSFVEKQQTDVLIDNLNKTYVAFTRPRTELHILGKEPAKPRGGRNSRTSRSAVIDTEPAKNLTELISRLAPEIMVPMTAPQGTKVAWYEYGEMSSRDEIVAKMSGQSSDTRGIDVSHYPVMPIPVHLRVRVENASSTRIRAGVRLHGLLSRIHDRDDVDLVITYGKKHGIITDDPDDPCGIDNVIAHVRRPIMEQDGMVARWFDPHNTVYSERTITAASTSLWDEDGIENLRPDRIIRRPDGTILVIDYKSGERRDKQYCNQVKRYIDKLRLIFPGTPIAGRIWYVTHDLILDESGKTLSMDTDTKTTR